MTRIDTVLLKVASRCNIDCTYCYVYNMGDIGWSKMPKTMSPSTISATVHALGNLLQVQQSPFAVVLHGGEPFLLAEASFAVLLKGLRDVLGEDCPISIQTNGILLKDSTLAICSRTRTSISISLDGPKEVNDRNRLGFSKETTFDATMAGIRRIQNHPDTKFLFTGTLSVIAPDSDPRSVYDFFKGLGVPSMNFLYRDGNHDRLPVGKSAFESVEYGSWLAKLWGIYMGDPNPVPIRVLDDITRLILGGEGTKEGCGTSDYGIIIIDTDGTVTKNDTLKSTSDGADRFQSGWSVHTDDLAAITDTQEFQEYHRLQQPTSDTCVKCRLRGMCGGGMPLSRWKSGTRYDNPSVYCRDHMHLIDHVADRLKRATICLPQLS
jgi:uncharacterized protein